MVSIYTRLHAALQHGQMLDAVRVLNPFRATPAELDALA
jgi:hypothetical protein